MKCLHLDISPDHFYCIHFPELIFYICIMNIAYFFPELIFYICIKSITYFFLGLILVLLISWVTMRSGRV